MDLVTQTAAGRAFLAPPRPSVARVFIGAGLSFDVPRSIWDDATFQATRGRRVMFVALMPKGEYLISSSHDFLMGKGATAVAWITPQDSSLL